MTSSIFISCLNFVSIGDTGKKESERNQQWSSPCLRVSLCGSYTGNNWIPSLGFAPGCRRCLPPLRAGLVKRQAERQTDVTKISLWALVLQWRKKLVFIIWCNGSVWAAALTGTINNSSERDRGLITWWFKAKSSSI